MTTKHGREPTRVAIVDDHRLVLEAIAARLETDPLITVAVAEPTWVGLLDHPSFPVDVVILDLELTDTISLSAKLRVLRTAGVSAVVMSGHADAGSIYTAMRAGASAFVPKTESLADLIAAIHSAAGGSRYDNAVVQQALAAMNESADAQLGHQEHRALALYAAGRSAREVAAVMGTTEDTVKSYIKRGRRKYKSLGIDLGTRVSLRRHGLAHGWLHQE